MSITYTWEVTGLKTTSVGSTKNVIVQTYWKKIGTDADGNTGEFAGATPFDVDPAFVSSKDYTTFKKLDEATVLSWIQSRVIGEYEEHVNEQIQKQINNKANPVVDTAIPWATSNT